MKKKKILLPLIIVFSIALLLFGENNRSDELPIFKIKNKELPILLDSLIEHEKKMSYYNEKLLFTIHIQKRGDVSLVQIGSIGNRKIKRDDELGCFNYKGYFFILSGNVVEKTIFEKTKKTEKINYYIPKDGIDSTGTVYIDVYEDDIYTYWNYKYYNKHFYKL